MATFGDILLRFGATGAQGEAPLRFRTAHINLLVGPNNSGKSLMLRELSGVNPRDKKRFSWGPATYNQTAIVESVQWDEKVSRPLQQEVLAAIFAANNSEWNELKSSSWDQLVPALEPAAIQFTDIRARLCAVLFELAAVHFADWKDIAWDFAQASIKNIAPMAIGGAFVLLQMTRMNEAMGAIEISDPPSSLANRRIGPLTPEQATAMLRALEEAWGRCEAVFSTLGVDTRDLSLASLLDANALGGAFLMELTKNPWLNRLISSDPRLVRLARPTGAMLETVRRFTAVAGWLIDPEPLERLALVLRETYARVTWAEPSRREMLAREVLYLDGMARLEVTSSAKLSANEHKDNSQPVILTFLKSPELRERLRALTVDALDAHLVVDMTTHAPQVVWRLAQEAPPKGLENTFYIGDTNPFLEAAALLDDRSDGIHAFVGMLAAILARPTDLVFIDEPEAFLHPPLVRKLARQLALLARESGRQFFIATHSADLLESFVSVGVEVNIIRLTHDSERSTARLLDSDALRHLARDPLLRSEATLSALFHEGAVVCESAGDRVLYKEINERLLACEDGGLDSCAFLNAQNWQTTARMIEPLREMGVAAAAVLDADTLFGKELGAILKAAQVDKVIRTGWLQQRAGLKEQIAARLGNELDKTSLKGEIIAGLTPSEREIFTELRSSMARYGVFVVPVGELENWLTSLGLRPNLDDKNRWLREALDHLGIDPQDESYIRPRKGDIWDFIRSVNAWILDPERKGTSPSPHPEDRPKPRSRRVPGTDKSRPEPPPAEPPDV